MFEGRADCEQDYVESPMQSVSLCFHRLFFFSRAEKSRDEKNENENAFLLYCESIIVDIALHMKYSFVCVSKFRRFRSMIPVIKVMLVMRVCQKQS